MFLRFAGLCLSAALLSACAEQWAKPGATPQQFDAQNSACTAQASAKFPPLMRSVPLGDGYTTPVVTQCSHSPGTETCTRSGGDYVPPTVMAVDDNEDARDAARRSCLYAHGWKPVE